MSFRGKLVPAKGHWWAVVDESDGWRIWAPVGSLSLSVKEAMGCYRIAYYYFVSGILGAIVKSGVRENGKHAEAFQFPDCQKEAA